MEVSEISDPVYKVNFDKNNVGVPISTEEIKRLGNDYIDKTPVLILVYKMNSKNKAIGISGIWTHSSILEYDWVYDKIYYVSPTNITNVFIEGLTLEYIATRASLIRIITPKITYGEAITFSRYLDELQNGISITKSLVGRLINVGVDQPEAYMPLIHYGSRKGTGYKINITEYNDPDLSIEIGRAHV